MQITLNHILVLSTLLFFIGVFGLFTRRNIITIAAAEAAVAIAIIINLYRHQQSIDVEDATEMKF